MAEKRLGDGSGEEELGERVESACREDGGETEGLDDAGYVVGERVSGREEPEDGVEVEEGDDPDGSSGYQTQPRPFLSDFHAMRDRELGKQK